MTASGAIRPVPPDGSNWRSCPIRVIRDHGSWNGESGTLSLADPRTNGAVSRSLAVPMYGSDLTFNVFRKLINFHFESK
jgi:hypothetical protein